MRKTAILAVIALAALCAAAPSALAVDITYCPALVENNTVYRFTQDIEFTNSSAYNYACFSRIATPFEAAGNVTIDMNGYQFYPMSNNTAIMVYMRGGYTQDAGWTIKNGTINFSKTLPPASFSGMWLEGSPVTVTNITMDGAGIGAEGLGVTAATVIGILDSKITGFTAQDVNFYCISQSQIYSCNVTFGTSRHDTGCSATFYSTPCTGGENTTVTTTTLDPFTSSTASAVDGLATYTGAIIGTTNSGGKFILWTILTIIVTIAVSTKTGGLTANNSWVLDSVVFLIFIGLGAAINWIPAWIAVAVMVIGALAITKAVGGG